MVARIGSHTLPAQGNARALAAVELTRAKGRLKTAAAAVERAGNAEAGKGIALALDVVADVQAELRNHRFEGTE